MLQQYTAASYAYVYGVCILFWLPHTILSLSSIPCSLDLGCGVSSDTYSLFHAFALPIRFTTLFGYSTRNWMACFGCTWCTDERITRLVWIEHLKRERTNLRCVKLVLLNRFRCLCNVRFSVVKHCTHFSFLFGFFFSQFDSVNISVFCFISILPNCLLTLCNWIRKAKQKQQTQKNSHEK